MDHALESFFREQSWLRALARSLVRDDAEAEDLVQETWLAALQNPPKNPEEPRRWLRVVIRRLASRRRARRELELAEPDARIGSESLPEAVAARWESSTLLREAIEALPAPERSVILLRYQEEGSLEAVAAALRVSQRTVSERLRSARDRLRVRLGDRFEEDHATLPAWLAALAPLVEVEEWSAAVAARLARATKTTGAAAAGIHAGGVLWSLFAVGILVLAGVWIVPAWRGVEATPTPTLPPRLAAAELRPPAVVASRPDSPSADVALSRTAPPADAAAARSTPAPAPRGPVRVDLLVTTTDDMLRDYRVRLVPPPGTPAFANASVALSLGGSARVEIPGGPDLGPVALLLEPDPREQDPTSHVGRPSFRATLEPGALDATVTLRPHLVLGDPSIEVPDTARPDDPRATAVVLERTLEAGSTTWSVTAKAVVRRGRAEFRDLPAGIYEAEFRDGTPSPRRVALEVLARSRD